MPETCPYGDPLCPCPDGLLCHYEGEDAWDPPGYGTDHDGDDIIVLETPLRDTLSRFVEPWGWG